jgi:hypothetical protein
VVWVLGLALLRVSRTSTVVCGCGTHGVCDGRWARGRREELIWVILESGRRGGQADKPTTDCRRTTRLLCTPALGAVQPIISSPFRSYSVHARSATSQALAQRRKDLKSSATATATTAPGREMSASPTTNRTRTKTRPSRHPKRKERK